MRLHLVHTGGKFACSEQREPKQVVTDPIFVLDANGRNILNEDSLHVIHHLKKCLCGLVLVCKLDFLLIAHANLHVIKLLLGLLNPWKHLIPQLFWDFTDSSWIVVHAVAPQQPGLPSDDAHW